jgi:hypothetical protein
MTMTKTGDVPKDRYPDVDRYLEEVEDTLLHVDDPDLRAIAEGARSEYASGTLTIDTLSKVVDGVSAILKIADDETLEIFHEAMAAYVGGPAIEPRPNPLRLGPAMSGPIRSPPKE